jgi:hypothetical protein
MGFLLDFSHRNRKSIASVLITMALFGLYPLPLIAGIISLWQQMRL